MPFMKHFPELEPIRKDIEGKRVAIVGNSPCIFDGKYGFDIDNHDFIIRFNRGFITKEECQGSRTDLLILACPLSLAEKDLFHPKYIANRSGSYKNDFADFTINNYDRAVMKESLGSQPSTGFMAVNICLAFSAKEIDLYGFDGTGISYPNDKYYKTLHNMSKEMEILKGWQSIGMIKINGY